MKKSNYALYLAGLLNEYGEQDFEGPSERDSSEPHNNAIDENSPEFKSWLAKFEIKFPEKEHPEMSPTDQHNLYTGRILSVLDEFGMTDKWTQYETSDLRKKMNNYEDLVLKLVGTAHPEMLEAYRQYYGINP